MLREHGLAADWGLMNDDDDDSNDGHLKKKRNDGKDAITLNVIFTLWRFQ